METKFKVGDRVEVLVDDWKEYEIGDIGTIVDISEMGVYQLEAKVWGDGTHCPYYEEELRHARIKDTKIARKMKKDQIDKIEEGWIYLK